MTNGRTDVRTQGQTDVKVGNSDVDLNTSPQPALETETNLIWKHCNFTKNHTIYGEVIQEAPTIACNF